jgi:hypothetical protein
MNEWESGEMLDHDGIVKCDFDNQVEASPCSEDGHPQKVTTRKTIWYFQLLCFHVRLIVEFTKNE